MRNLRLKGMGVIFLAAGLVFLSGCSESSGPAGGEGQSLFKTWCAPCHGPDGSGGLGYKGPSLHGPEFIYGGEREAILASIRDGRGEDMPAFSSRLNQEKLDAVVDYVLSLRNE